MMAAIALAAVGGGIFYGFNFCQGSRSQVSDRSHLYHVGRARFQRQSRSYIKLNIFLMFVTFPSRGA